MLKKISILGAGESGTGAAILAKQKGYEPFVSDFGSIKNKYKDILYENSIKWEENKHTSDIILNAVEVIKSPGIPDKAPIIQEILNKKIPIISEIEFAARYTNAYKICITGSNGKTTTTQLIYYILKNAGYNVGLAGNVGDSFAYQVATRNFDYYVLELSSFQLDNMYNFKAETAIILNITPDHLDRYNYNFQNYINSKFRILQNQTENDNFIYCSDDQTINNELLNRTLLQKTFRLSLFTEPEQGSYFKNENMYIKLNNNEILTNSQNMSLMGKHNQYNSMAAAIAAKLAQIRNEVIRSSFQSFKGVEHRLENYITVRGVQFINDSKATNVNSMWYALESMQTPVILIMGGVDKGNNYSEVEELIIKKVKKIVALGKDNSPIHKFFDGKIEIFDSQNMENAVNTAFFLAEKGDTVLLSPACASFDLFENYEDRGRKFKLAVSNL